MPPTDPDRPLPRRPGDVAMPLPGSIQPHGAMILCNPGSLGIRHASRNLAAITGWTGDLFPGIDAAAVLGGELVHDLRNAAARAASTGGTGIVMGARIGTGAGRFDLAVQARADRLLIEIEPRPATAPAGEAILDLARQVFARINRERDPARLPVLAARLAQVLLGYDRVTIRRDAPGTAAQVLAEAGALPPLPGRGLAALPDTGAARPGDGAIRMIPDAACLPVPLDPVAEGEAPQDLSQAALRAVTAEEAAALSAMGAAAALTIPLAVDGEAWGQIACHHGTPRLAPMPLRIAAELFAHCLALRIGAAHR